MASHEKNAREKGDIFSGMKDYANAAAESGNPNGKVIDLLLPIPV